MWGCHILMMHRLGANDGSSIVAVVWCSTAHALVCPWCWARIVRCWVYCGVYPLVAHFRIPPGPYSQLQHITLNVVTNHSKSLMVLLVHSGRFQGPFLSWTWTSIVAHDSGSWNGCWNIAISHVQVCTRYVSVVSGGHLGHPSW
jgi:hypothetical protein